MADGEKSGLRTAVAEEFRADTAVPGSVAAIQLPLLPLRQMVEAQEAAEPDAPSGKGPGRPAGSRNKNTEAWRSFILSRYQSPLVAMAETFNRSLAELAKDLGYADRKDADGKLVPITPGEMLELLKIQMQCAKEIAPYLHSKQPIGVDLGEGGLMQLIINTGIASAGEVEQAGAMRLNFLDVEDQSNQGLSGDDPRNSVASHSVDPDNSLSYQGEADANTPD